MKQFLMAAMTAAAVAAGGSAQAANVSFAGSLSGDDDVQLFTFSLAAASNVTMRTWSYAGGVNAAGSVIAAGGFDPIVSIFFGTGGAALLFDANDDGAGVAVDPVTGFAFDSLLQEFSLGTGTYTVALTQFASFASGPTLGDGFQGSGTVGFGGRSARWALDILGVNAANRIPEPATLALAVFALAAAGAGGAASRRSRLSR